MGFQTLPVCSFYNKSSLIDLLSIIDRSVEVEDERLIQHIFGLLMGDTSKLLNFKNSDSEPLIRFKDLSASCSRSFLYKIGKFGVYIQLLIDFITNCFETDDSSNYTLLSYSLTLRDILNHSVYKILLNQCDFKSATLFHIFDYLESKESGFVLEKVKLLYEITKVIKERINHWSADVIDVVYNYLSLDQMYQSNLIIDLFLSSIKPSMVYIEALLTKGEENDPNNEFFFKIDYEVEIDDFWDKCLQSKNKLPAFFVTSFEKLNSGIKSRLIMKKFDSQNLFKEVIFQKESFFDIFKRYLLSFLQFSEIREDHQCRHEMVDCLKLRLTEDILKDKIVTLKHKHLDLSQVEEKASDNFPFLQAPEPKLSSFLSSSRNAVGMPIQVALQKSYALTLQQFCQPIDSWLVNYAHQTYLQHLQLLNSYFLLQQSSAQLSDYFHAMFTDITDCSNTCLNGLFWQNYYFNDHKIHAFLSHVGLSDKKLTSLVYLANIHLIYEDLDWISQTIIDMTSRDVYDSAFQLLVKLKYNKWLLENLKYSKANWKQQHRLFLARHRLLFIANNMFYFTMNSIHRAVHVLDQDNESSLNYKDLRRNYQKFIHTIKCTTFQSQSESSKIVLKLINTLCKLALKLYEIWNSDLSKADQFLAENNLDNFEKALKLFLFRCDLDNDVVAL